MDGRWTWGSGVSGVRKANVGDKTVIDMLFSCSAVMAGGLGGVVSGRQLGKWCEEVCNKTTCCLVAVL